MSSGEPGRVVVTAATAFESRAGAEGAQQECGIRRPFTLRGRGSSSELGDSLGLLSPDSDDVADGAPTDDRLQLGQAATSTQGGTDERCGSSRVRRNPAVDCG